MRVAILAILLASIAAVTVAQNPTSLSSEYQPQTPVREYFLGAWKLVSTEKKYPDGRVTPYPDLGPDAAGFLMYTPSGHMCAQLMKPGRPRWAGDTPTAAEAASALDGFTSYCGAFEVHEKERIMVHLPETAGSPNWSGTVQKRPYYLVSQDRFFFRGMESEKQKDGNEISVTWTITWERLK
jgi:hypothetical protein